MLFTRLVLIALSTVTLIPAHANDPRPAFTIADCDLRLGGTGGPNLATVTIQVATNLGPVLARLRLSKGDLEAAIRGSVREAMRLGERPEGPTYLLFLEPRDAPFAIRVEFVWWRRHDDVRVYHVSRYDSDRDRALGNQFVATSLVRGHAFTISRRALAHAGVADISALSIDQALGNPVAPPVARGNHPDEVWQMGRADAHAFLSLTLALVRGVLHVEDVHVPALRERNAYLAKSGAVHDDPDEQTISITEGVLAGRSLTFLPGVQNKLKSRGITKDMIADAARTAPGLIKDWNQTRGRLRQWFAGRAGEGFLNVTLGSDVDGVLVILSAIETGAAGFETCAFIARKQIEARLPRGS